MTGNLITQGLGGPLLIAQGYGTVVAIVRADPWAATSAIAAGLPDPWAATSSVSTYAADPWAATGSLT